MLFIKNNNFCGNSNLSDKIKPISISILKSRILIFKKINRTFIKKIGKTKNKRII